MLIDLGPLGRKLFASWWTAPVKEGRRDAPTDPPEKQKGNLLLSMHTELLSRVRRRCFGDVVLELSTDVIAGGRTQAERKRRQAGAFNNAAETTGPQEQAAIFNTSGSML